MTRSDTDPGRKVEATLIHNNPSATDPTRGACYAFRTGSSFVRISRAHLPKTTTQLMARLTHFPEVRSSVAPARQCASAIHFRLVAAPLSQNQVRMPEAGRLPCNGCLKSQAFRVRRIRFRPRKSLGVLDATTLAFDKSL